MTNHKFTSQGGSRGKCDQCGKTRNARIHRAADEPTIRLWVGWRINNATVLRSSTPVEKSLTTKLKSARITSEMDRFVHLTKDELLSLDEVAQTFEKPGNPGPVVYSARTLRRRIAEAINTLKEDKK